ncbi:hypothetical protein VULLAG_LOCUS19993 [Vulpes lagopus]
MIRKLHPVKCQHAQRLYGAESWALLKLHVYEHICRRGLAHTLHPALEARTRARLVRPPRPSSPGSRGAVLPELPGAQVSAKRQEPPQTVKRPPSPGKPR